MNEPEPDPVVEQPVPETPVVEVLGRGRVIPAVEGEMIIIEAVAEIGWRFDGWFGSISSADNPLSISALEAQRIGARFVPDVMDLPGDTDQDGIVDTADMCPGTGPGVSVDENGCVPPPPDTDRDAIPDELDNCPNTVMGEPVNADGCATSQRDSDGDGISDAADRCSETLAGSSVNEAGCSDLQLDADRDGVRDDRDACPQTPIGAAVDIRGCGRTQIDSDSDGVADDTDQCPGTPTGPMADSSGCAASQRDADHDRITDDLDQCPNTSAMQAVDLVGCPVVPSGPGGGSSGGGGGGTAAVCGNAALEPGEGCDPPACNLCSAACQSLGSFQPGVWEEAFDTTATGVLSAVWGWSPREVFVVGGTDQQGRVFHFNGTGWAQLPVPPVPLLIWVYGFSPQDVYAVGRGGTVLHYDGTNWNVLQSGTTVDLWGIWGSSSSDLWMVGGSAFEGEPVILHYNGNSFSPFAVPNNDSGAHALFKVWGFASKVFAVGQNGLIVQFVGGQWVEVESGSSEDFISLWGTSESNIVAVGGQSAGRIARYDGTNWSTSVFAEAQGLQSVYVTRPDQAMVGGLFGYLAFYNPITNELTPEDSTTNGVIHAIWSDCEGKYYGVGGQFNPLFTGVSLVRTQGEVTLRRRTSQQLGVDRNVPAESSLLVTCMFGPGVVPSPTGGITTLRCLNSFDFEDDRDIDLFNVAWHQASLPPETPPRIELGLALNGKLFEPLDDGDPLPVYRGTQGGMHVFISIRGFGFQPNSTVRISQMGVFTDSEALIFQTNMGPFAFNGTGVNRYRNHFVQLCTPSPSTCLRPGEADGREAEFTFRVSDSRDPAITAEITQRFLLQELP